MSQFYEVIFLRLMDSVRVLKISVNKQWFVPKLNGLPVSTTYFPVKGVFGPDEHIAALKRESFDQVSLQIN